MAAIVLAATALASRLWGLAQPATVTWDEAHFGKFAAYYVNRTWYFDVHPPLGKLLLGAVAGASGFNGSYDFPSSATYPSDVPYVPLRAYCAVLSAAAVPLVYSGCRRLGLTRPAAVAAAVMVLGDTAEVALGRLILLDSALVFGTALALWALARFRATRARPFGGAWWGSLGMLGLALGISVSVKWVGLFTIAWVGLYTLADLWELWGDRGLPWARVAAHVAARALCLIAVPAAVYLASFAAHFAVLTHTGPGDSAMPSLFQAALVGSPLATQPPEVVFGSLVTLRNNGAGGALLHSHVQTYPAGSKQQCLNVGCIRAVDGSRRRYTAAHGRQ